MARAYLRDVVEGVDSSGRLVPISGATVYIYRLGTTTAIAETMYASRTGTTTVSNPLQTDASGVFSAYRAEPGAVTVQVVKSGYTFAPVQMEFENDQSNDGTVDVRAYGAVGDGVTDDSAAIQAAADAFGSAGGTLTFSGGPGAVYLIDSENGTFTYTDAGGASSQSYGLKLKSNVKLRLDGATIKRGASFPVNGFLVAATTAVSYVTISDGVIDNGVTDATINTARGARSMALYFRYGADYIRVRNMRFINIGTQAGVVQVGTDSPTEPSQANNVKFVDCQFERSLPGPILDPDTGLILENVSVLRIWNTSRVTWHGVRFFSTLTGVTAGLGGGAIYAGSATACGPSTPMHTIRVVDCDWEAVQITALFIRGVPGSVMMDVLITGCNYRAGGKWGEKGFLSLQDLGAGGVMYGAKVIGNTIRNFGYYNSAAGSTATHQVPDAINAGNDVISGLEIIGNTIDGEVAYAAQTAPFGQQRGITLATSIGAVVSANTILFLGGPGIFLDGGTGTIVQAGHQRTSITGNTIRGCAQRSENGLICDGITINDFVTDVDIVGNNITDCGSSAGSDTAAAGIGFLASTAADSSTYNITIANNTSHDTRSGGSRTQKYGVRLGLSTDAIRLRPYAVTIINNNLSNNTVAAICADTTYVLNNRLYHIEGNVGWQQAAVTASTMTGSILAGGNTTQGPIAVPGATVGDVVTVSKDGGLNMGLLLFGTVTAANQVTVCMLNFTAGSLTPAAGNLRVQVAHRNQP